MNKSLNLSQIISLFICKIAYSVILFASELYQVICRNCSFNQKDQIFLSFFVGDALLLVYIYGMTSLDLILLWFGFFSSSVIIVVCIYSFSLTTKFSYLNLLTMDDILTSIPHIFDFEKLQTSKKN